MLTFHFEAIDSTGEIELGHLRAAKFPPISDAAPLGVPFFAACGIVSNIIREVSHKAIAKTLGRSASTISRELSRHHDSQSPL